MLCSSIKLTDRKEVKHEPTSQIIKSTALSQQELLMTSDYCQSYSFRWDKPKLFYNYDSSHFLTVNNLILPDNARAFNTGSSLEKWSKKRPRLKSTKLKPLLNTSPEDNFDVTPLIEEISKESIPSLETNDSESEIDPDIKNLLSVVQDGYNQGEEDPDNWKRQHKKHRHKRKDKNSSDGSKEKSKKKKAIKFSLSKPPSPQTVQVIRVEVTSNYSLEEPEAVVETDRLDLVISDCSKGCGLRIKSASDLKKSLTRMELEDFTSKEIMIQCNKLALCNRK